MSFSRAARSVVLLRWRSARRWCSLVLWLWWRLGASGGRGGGGSRRVDAEADQVEVGLPAACGIPPSGQLNVRNDCHDGPWDTPAM